MINRPVFIAALFALLILYFTGCQKPEHGAGSRPDGDYPPSSPVEIKASPDQRLFQICPAGKIKESPYAAESNLIVFRHKLEIPNGCALNLDNSVYHPQEGVELPSLALDRQPSYYLRYAVEGDAPVTKNCVPQNSVWLKIGSASDNQSYTEQYERMDLPVDQPKEFLYLYGHPNPFPHEHVGMRKAFCE